MQQALQHIQGVMKTFSQLLSEYINRVGVSDTELARRLGVSRQTIFRWREGKTNRPRHREDVVQLATKLRLSPKERDALLVAGGFRPEGQVDDTLLSDSSSIPGDDSIPAASGTLLTDRFSGVQMKLMQHKRLSILVAGLVLIGLIVFVTGWWRDLAAGLGFDDDLSPVSSEWPLAASADETLILVSEFANYGGEKIGYNIAGRIREALLQEIVEIELENVRIELLPQVVTNEVAAQHMYELFGASIVIWGEYDSGRVIAVISAPMAEEQIESKEQRWLITTSEELNSIVNNDLPRDVRWLSLYVLGRMYLSNDNYDQAEQAFRRALSEASEDASKSGRIYFFLGLVESEVTDSDINEVIAYYTEAIAQFPELISAFNNRGVAYLDRGQVGDLERAQDDFRVVMEMDQAYEPAVINLAIALFHQDPQNSDAWLDLLLQFEAQQSATADLYNTLCWYLSLAGRPDEALPYCDRAVAMNPSGYTNDSRGLALALLGRYEEAAQEFRNFLSTLVSHNPTAYQYFAPTRSAWIEALQDGRNPFDEETLETLLDG
jgi:tetratricopeptide (TPR) repeat protein/transcriptional regulator with XRE-family HTH domain